MKRLLSEAEAAEYIGMGRTKGREMLSDWGALRKLGTRSLYDKAVIDLHLDDLPVGTRLDRKVKKKEQVAECEISNATE